MGLKVADSSLGITATNYSLHITKGTMVCIKALEKSIPEECHKWLRKIRKILIRSIHHSSLQLLYIFKISSLLGFMVYKHIQCFCRLFNTFGVFLFIVCFVLFHFYFGIILFLFLYHVFQIIIKNNVIGLRVLFVLPEELYLNLTPIWLYIWDITPIPISITPTSGLYKHYICSIETYMPGKYPYTEKVKEKN